MDCKTTRSDMDRIRSLGIAAPSLPISFTYGGKRYKGLDSSSRSSRLLDANMVETTLSLRLDQAVTVQASVITYRDYPAVEWTVYFRNEGDCESAMLEDVNAADLCFTGSNPRVITNNGDTGEIDGYTDTVTSLSDGLTFTHATIGGRPCHNAFPYQRLLFDDYGYHIAIGWPGQWTSQWTGTSEGAHFTAGQETVHTVLRPGECFRSPRMCVVAFEGDLTRGVNVWRRWYFAHVMPRRNGQALAYSSHDCDNDFGIEFTKAEEGQQLRGIHDVYHSGLRPDVWWIDAGWYPCKLNDERIWQVTGTWEPDKERFPHGLKPIGDAAKEAGMDFLVWFEPERVYPHTWLSINHPEWMLHRADPAAVYPDRPENMLLNLADKDCLTWLCDHISKLITESGITIYRQDFNIRPLPFWRENEAEDRQGMLENQYLQGYLAYWDKLLLDHPDLMIDSCASGGRRNDLESMRRAVPLHQTDFGYGHHPTKQKYSQHFYSWIPFFRGYAESWDKDDGEYAWPDFYEPAPHLPLTEFDMMATISPMMALLYYPYVVDRPEVAALQRDMLTLDKRVRDLLRGDFYPLSKRHCDADKWSAWQFYTPEKGQGILQFFRNIQAPEETFTARLHGLDPNARYRFENGRTGDVREMTGNQAMTTGFVEKLEKRQATLWIYGILA